jgi:hypothetical protein
MLGVRGVLTGVWGLPYRRCSPTSAPSPFTPTLTLPRQGGGNSAEPSPKIGADWH